MSYIQSTSVKNVYSSGQFIGTDILKGKINQLKIYYIRNHVTAMGKYYTDTLNIHNISFNISMDDIDAFVVANDSETTYAALSYMEKLEQIALDILITEMATYFADVEVADLEKV